MKCRQCGFESPPGMRFCGNCGARLDAPIETPRPKPTHTPDQAVSGGAQRRHLTVMFCDMVESTALAERLDPEDFREILSAYQAACVRAVDRVGGYTARFVGDGVIAYFGYPRAHEDDAQRAVHAALGIQTELLALNPKLKGAYGVSVVARIALHSGVAIAGEMGAGNSRIAHDLVGELPHIASRLQSVATPGSVVISEATLDMVAGYFETESLGQQMLKGISRPIGAHRVLRPTGAVGRLEVAGGTDLTPVIGRDAELAALTAAWEQAKHGAGVVAHVVGEAGIGKSRVIHALMQELGDQPGERYTWQCSAHHRGTALYPVSRFLERLLELDRGRPALIGLKALSQRVVDAGLDPGETVPLLADLTSLPAESSEARSPLDARTATLHAIESLLIADPARHPLLLVVEDLHWADPTTVELLGRLVASIRSLPVLLVLSFRQDFEPPWAGLGVVEVPLGPLSSDEVRAMAAAVIDRPLDPAVIDWVDSTADGVPLFVEEMLKMVGPDGVNGGKGGPHAASVPPTLEGLLTERLDRLPELSDVIDMAAVLGKEFERSLLEALDPLDGGDLEPALMALAAQDVLRPVVGAVSRCEFTHALVQEAAYERLLRGRRHVLHSRVADTLTRDFATVAEREPEVIAYHWSCAAEPGKATMYWHAAGTRALERAAFLEAAEHFRRGLEALDDRGPLPGDDELRADHLTHLAASLQAGHGYAAAGVEGTYAKAREACARAASVGQLGSVIRGEWMFYLLRGQYQESLALADEMLELGGRDGDPARLAEGHLYRGLVDMYLGEFQSARHHLTESMNRYQPPAKASQIYDAQGDTGVGALAYLALVLWNLGFDDESRMRSDRSLVLAEQVSAPVARAQAWGMRGILHLSRSEPSELAHWVQMSKLHNKDHNIGYWLNVATLISSWMRGRSGELELGLTRVRDNLDAYARSGNRLSLPHFNILHADLLIAAGDRRRALDVLRAGEHYIEETGERFSESELHRFRARVLMAGDSPDVYGATASLRRSIEVARAQQAKLLELRAVARFASHQAGLGEPRPALDELASVCEWFPEECAIPDLVRARRMLAAEPSAP